MRNKPFAALCLLLCALCAVTACAKPGHTTGTAARPAETGSPTASTPSGTPEPTPVTPTPVTPTPVTPSPVTPTPVTPTPTPEPPLTVDAMNVEQIGERLYKLKDAGAERLAAGIIYGRHLVTLNDADGNAAIRSRDLTTGESRILCTFGNGVYGSFLKLDRGGFLFKDLDGLCLFFEDALDDDPEVLRQAIRGDPVLGEWVDCDYLKNGVRILVKDDVLTAEDLFGEESVTVTIPEKYPYICLIDAVGDKLAFYAPIYGDEVITCFLTLDRDGVFEEVGQGAGNSFAVSACRELFSGASGDAVEFLSFPGLETERTVGFHSTREFFTYSNGRYLVTSTYLVDDDLTLSFYDYDGKLYFKSTPPYDYSSVLDIEGDLVLLRCSLPGVDYDNDEPNDTVCLLDLSGTVGKERPDYARIREEKIKALEEQYPVTILAGEDAIIDFPDFVAETATGDARIVDGLEILEGVLSDFPAGFLDELFDPDDEWPVDRLTVCLTGKLTPTIDYSTSTPSAYAYTGDGVQYIVADLGYLSGLRSTFAHELMHAIDFRLDWITFYDAYPDWYHYVPYMSLYNYGYVDGDGNDFGDYSYTTNDEGREWFLDAYSKTFPIEDRARLFENMFCYESNDCWYRSYGRIIDRMAYLARVIRANFVSVQNSPERPIWEKALETARPQIYE